MEIITAVAEVITAFGVIFGILFAVFGGRYAELCCKMFS